MLFAGTVESILSVHQVQKTYAGGFQALQDINLEIQTGEIFALLGPNGAGKTTLISMVCGITTVSGGEIRVGGYDILKDFRRTRALIGLVPQELTTDAFETVWATVNFSRGLFGLAPNDGYIEDLLKVLSLWDKRNNKLLTLSGGMKRRVMIAKALSHEPKLLFLDEPTAGVDVELRKDMWAQVRKLRESGVTIVLTTHYIEEAEEMADRVGVINHGKIILVERKAELMKKLGKKHVAIDLSESLPKIPDRLSPYDLKAQGNQLIYTYDSQKADNEISKLFEDLFHEGIVVKDLHTKESSLEEIFVELVKRP